MIFLIALDLSSHCIILLFPTIKHSDLSHSFPNKFYLEKKLIFNRFCFQSPETKMPPKKGGNKVNAKNEKAKKEKIIEDKTFGLKNKKGGKAQKVKNEIYGTPTKTRLKKSFSLSKM